MVPAANRKIRSFITLFCLLAGLLPGLAEESGIRRTALLSGRVVSTDSTTVNFATVYLKDTPYGCSSDEQGLYHLKAPAGTYELVVSAVGFETARTPVTLRGESRERRTVILRPAVTRVEEVVVEASGVSRVRQSAFNAVAIGTDALQNASRNLGDALSQLPGMKVRESGGVGSDMQLMLDGFSGRHVKVFIDGVPQEGAGAAFDLNNIPVNFAERIEVYKGVVPVGFGTDAIGGVINIVTNKRQRSWFADASYSYGSFNTHKSHLNFGQTLKNGFTYEINAFQNYSDNNYRIDNWVREFRVEEDGTVVKLPVDENDVKRVRRFNDRFHNEVVQGKIGVVGRKWADRLLLGFAWSHFYKEIQTGVYQEIVFGQKHRKGHSFSPSLEYRKRDQHVAESEREGYSGCAFYTRNDSRHEKERERDTEYFFQKFRGGENAEFLGAPEPAAYDYVKSGRDQRGQHDSQQWDRTFVADEQICFGEQYIAYRQRDPGGAHRNTERRRQVR